MSPVPIRPVVGRVNLAPNPASSLPSAPRPVVAKGAAVTVASFSPAATPPRPRPAGPSGPNLRAEVNRSIAAKGVPGLKNIAIFNTSELDDGYFHCILYGETDARKSATAALFGDPEDVRIILNRRREQAIPLRKLGYTVAHCDTAEKVKDALMYPEALFGEEWAGRSDPVLVLDDITYFKDLELEANETKTVEIGGREVEKEVRDGRLIHKGALETMWDVVCRGVLLKPFHFIAVALADTRMPNPNEERVAPDLPKKMAAMLGTDFEYVFYVDKATWKIWTVDHRRALKKVNERNKEETYFRTVFCKHKLPLELEGTGVILPEEELNLRGIWERVKSGKAAPKTPRGV